MSVQVTMLQTRRGEDGTLWVAGSPYTASDAFAAFLINSNLATGALPPAPQSNPTAARLAAVQADPSQDGQSPQRVWVLGDSLEMRQYRNLGTVTATVDGTDVELAMGSGALLPPIGSFVRIINQAEGVLNIDVPVVGSGTNSIIVRYPFDVSALWAGTGNASAYGITNDSGWVNYAAGLLAAQGKAIELVRNAGDGGDTSAQMLARLHTELAGVMAGDIVVACATTNDIGEVTAAEAMTNLAAIFDWVLARGATLHAGTLGQAQSSAYWADAAAALVFTRDVNMFVRSYCEQKSRVRCFDKHAALGSGDYASAGAVESAGIHYLPAGAQLVGNRYVTDCGADFRKSEFRRWRSTADAYVDGDSWNLLTNPEFEGATGSTPPTGWTASGAGTNTYTLSAGGSGWDLSFDKAHTAANVTTLTQDITGRLVAGRRYIMGVEFETIDQGESHYARMELRLTVGGVVYTYCIGNQHYSYAQGGTMPATGTRYLFELTSSDNSGRSGLLIPEGVTAAAVRFSMQLGASGDFELVWAKPVLYEVE